MKRILILLSFVSSSAFASSFVVSAVQDVKKPRCEITTKFLGEVVRGASVFWSFEAGTPTSFEDLGCAELTRAYEVFIPGAKPLSTGSQIAYPEYIPDHEPEKLYFMRLTRKKVADSTTGEKVNRWVVMGWSDGGFTDPKKRQ